MLGVRLYFPGRLNLYFTTVDIAKSRFIPMLVRGRDDSVDFPSWVGFMRGEANACLMLEDG